MFSEMNVSTFHSDVRQDVLLHHVTCLEGTSRSSLCWCAGKPCIVETDGALMQLQSEAQERLAPETPPAPLEISNGIPTLQVVPSRQPDCEAPKSRTMEVPIHVFGYVLSFCPLQSLPHAACVCSAWAGLARGAIKEIEARAEQYVHEGVRLMATTNVPRDSLNNFGAAVALFPRMFKAYYWAAKARLILQDRDGAIDVMHGALRRRPPPAEALRLHACLLYTHHDDLSASELLEAALRSVPNDATIHFDLGFCYQGLEEYAKALRCYTTALRLDYPRAFVALANRADCWDHFNKSDEALADLTASLRICPAYPGALRMRAAVRTRRGQPHAAYADYTALIETAPDAQAQCDAYCDRALCPGGAGEDDIDRARRVCPAGLWPVRLKADAMVSRGRVDEAIAYVTDWMAGAEADAECADWYALRGELHVVNCAWRAGIRDYETAISLAERTASPMDCNARRTILAYREILEDLKARCLP